MRNFYTGLVSDFTAVIGECPEGLVGVSGEGSINFLFELLPCRPDRFDTVSLGKFRYPEIEGDIETAARLRKA